MENIKDKLKRETLKCNMCLIGVPEEGKGKDITSKFSRIKKTQTLDSGSIKNLQAG